MGFVRPWSKHMKPHFGAPVKPVGLGFGGHYVKGEFVISARGVEGSAIYAISAQLREAMDRKGAVLTLDLLPDRTLDDVMTRLSKPRGRNSLSNHLRKTLGLTGVKMALMRECGPLPDTDRELARRIKALPMQLDKPALMDKAISTAGGVPQSALDTNLMLTGVPGVFCAGEMLDWEAPTGGYLLTACLATGRHAGGAGAKWLAQ